jgi:hypothetical protein
LEAIAHLSQGLELVATLPDGREKQSEELALRLAIGGPLIATNGYAGPEVERNYNKALALCEQLRRSAELFPVLRGLWNCDFVRGELRRAHNLADGWSHSPRSKGGRSSEPWHGEPKAQYCFFSAGSWTRRQR